MKPKVDTFQDLRYWEDHGEELNKNVIADS